MNQDEIIFREIVGLLIVDDSNYKMRYVFNLIEIGAFTGIDER